MVAFEALVGEVGPDMVRCESVKVGDEQEMKGISIQPASAVAGFVFCFHKLT